MKYLLVILTITLFTQCQSKSDVLSAQAIIDKAINTNCNGLCDTAEITFDFRDKKYRSKRNNGDYLFSRTIKDSINTIVDELSNNGHTRRVQGAIVKVPDSLVGPISEGVNSVHYFAQLPYGLNAPAVIKELLGETNIKEKPYYMIGVSFKQEGGGADFDDKFIYWVHKETFTVDYLAYSYSTNGGGIRFREAYNPRVLGGIRFVDYNNYKPEGLNTPLKALAPILELNKLTLLSKIELENISVK
ncbi:MAG: hypothetical protein ACI825_000226 [Planctomycetota bacterium]|jgi:hypothetical protein|uniref:DUF6503 family protein n=1 Tax=Patiriisocius sp. Uisw_047 TaxID=3230969 RepID=UPI0039E8414D